MYTVHVPASQLLSELGIFSTPGPCASPEQTEPCCADNPISQPKRYHRAPRKQIPAQNTALGQPEEELRLLTALPNRFDFPAVSLLLTTSGFQGQAEPFPCCDIASGRVRRFPNSAFGTASAQVQPLLPSTSASPVASGCTPALGLAQDAPKGASKGEGARGASGTAAFVSGYSKTWACPGSPPLSIGCGAGDELAWCTPPCCHLGWLEPPQDTVWDMGTPHGSLAWQPGAVEVHLLTSAIVPAHRHWRSLAAPALSRSKATPCPHGGEGQGGGGAGATGAERTAGHSQLGTGTQMVLPESCSSDQQVTGQERGLLGGEQSR